MGSWVGGNITTHARDNLGNYPQITARVAAQSPLCLKKQHFPHGTSLFLGSRHHLTIVVLTECCVLVCVCVCVSRDIVNDAVCSGTGIEARGAHPYTLTTLRVPMHVTWLGGVVHAMLTRSLDLAMCTHVAQHHRNMSSPQHTLANTSITEVIAKSSDDAPSR